MEHLAGDLLDPLQRVDEIHVPRGPSKLTIGDRLQTGLALELDRPDDRLVLGLPQVLAIDPSRLEVGPSPQQFWWPQEAADVVRAKRRKWT